jgi:predicted secreted protein
MDGGGAANGPVAGGVDDGGTAGIFGAWNMRVNSPGSDAAGGGAAGEGATGGADGGCTWNMRVNSPGSDAAGGGAAGEGATGGADGGCTWNMRVNSPGSDGSDGGTEGMFERGAALEGAAVFAGGAAFETTPALEGDGGAGCGAGGFAAWNMRVNSPGSGA